MAASLPVVQFLSSSVQNNDNSEYCHAYFVINIFYLYTHMYTLINYVTMKIVSAVITDKSACLPDSCGSAVFTISLPATNAGVRG